MESWGADMGRFDLIFGVLLWAEFVSCFGAPYEDTLLGVGVLVYSVMVNLGFGFQVWAELALNLGSRCGKFVSGSGILTNIVMADGLRFRGTNG